MKKLGRALCVFCASMTLLGGTGLVSYAATEDTTIVAEDALIEVQEKTSQVEALQSEPLSQLKINANGVILRKVKSTNGQSLGTLYNGDVVVVTLSQKMVWLTTKATGQPGWIEVYSVKLNRTGYVLSIYLN